MFGLFKKDPTKKLTAAIEAKREQALLAQRSGDAVVRRALRRGGGTGGQLIAMRQSG